MGRRPLTARACRSPTPTAPPPRRARPPLTPVAPEDRGPAPRPAPPRAANVAGFARRRGDAPRPPLPPRPPPPPPPRRNHEPLPLSRRNGRRQDGRRQRAE